jgi:5-methylcytosine-specific restriction protein A
MERNIGGYDFRLVAAIEPRRDAAGNVDTYTYWPPAGKRLNRHGRGPFCRFDFPQDWPYPGVYVIPVDGNPVYVGQCEDLSRRFGPQGYGHIARRNCLRDGQATNCKVNAHIAAVAARGSRVEVWFLQTHRRFQVEGELVRQLRPPWNSHRGRYSAEAPPSRGGTISMPAAEDFRRALLEIVAEAERSGARSITVSAGELHRRVGGYPGRNHRMPVCCEVMRSVMVAGDTIVSQPPAGQGASLAIQYRLPRPRPV